MSKIDMYVHAVLLLHGAGKEINAANITAVVKSAGAEVDEAKAKVLADALKDKKIDEMLEAPSMMMASAPAASSGGSHEKKEEKKEEKKDEKKSEEEAAAGLAGLFG